MGTQTEGPIHTKIYTTEDGRAVIQQSASSSVLFSAEQILAVVYELRACYDYCAVWKEPTLGLLHRLERCAADRAAGELRGSRSSATSVRQKAADSRWKRRFQPIDQLNLTASAGYTDAEFTALRHGRRAGFRGAEIYAARARD